MQKGSRYFRQGQPSKGLSKVGSPQDKMAHRYENRMVDHRSRIEVGPAMPDQPAEIPLQVANKEAGKGDRMRREAIEPIGIVAVVGGNSYCLNPTLGFGMIGGPFIEAEEAPIREDKCVSNS